MSRQTTRLFMLAALTLTVAACDRAPQPNEPGTTPAAEEVTLLLNWVPEPQFGGFYAADVIGAYAERGLDVDIQGGAGAPTLQQAALGRVDYAIVAGDQVVAARAEGLDVVALFAVYQTSPRAIMVHASQGFEEIGDIFEADVTLALEPGRNFSDFLSAQYGLNEEGTSVEIVPYAGALERFLVEPDFAMQCFATSEPIEVRQRAAANSELLGDVQVFPVADAGYNPYMTVLVTSASRLEENPDQVRRMVEAVAAGWNAYLENPTETNIMMGELNEAMDAETFALSAEAQRPLIANAETARHGLGYMSADRWEMLIDQLLDLGVIDREDAPIADDLFVWLLNGPTNAASGASANQAESAQPAD